jgi:hypothetical protein
MEPMNLDDLHIRVVPGDGLVARYPGLVAVAFPTGEAHRSFVTRLLDQLASASASDQPGRAAARAVAGLLATADESEALPLGLVGTAGDGVALLVHGDVELLYRLPGAGDEHLSGREAATWVDRILPAVPERWSLAAVGSGAADEWSDLRAGVVRGNGVAAAGTEVAAPEAQVEPETELAPPPTPPPPAEPEPVPVADFEAVSLTEPMEDEPPREPLPVATPDAPTLPVAAEATAPVVQGVLCAHGHFNDPSSAFCATCGISMVQQTHNLVEGPRPPLGVLVLDDGSTYVVDRDLVVGREPGHDPAVTAGTARPLELPDPERAISRVHARVTLHEWEVHVVDAGSANGTYVAARDATSWTPVPADAPAVLTPGMHVLIGQRVLSFDSHRRN